MEISYWKIISVHGVPFLSNTRNTCLRVFWVIILLLASILTIVEIGSRISHYLEYPKKTEVSLEYVSSSPPVTVTICTKLQLSDLDLSSIQTGSTNYAALLTDYVDFIADFENQSENKAEYDTAKNRMKKNMTLPSLAEIKAKYLETDTAALGSLLNAGLTTKKVNDANGNLASFPATIGDCTANGQPCMGNFQLIENTLLDRCMKFELSSSGLPVKSGNLKLEFSITGIQAVQDSDLQMSSSALGNAKRMSLYITEADRKIPVLTYDQSNAILPGYITSFSVKRTQMESLEEPYGDCGSKESIYTGLPYTQEDCSRRCYDDHLDTSCACIPASDAVINEAYRSMGYTYVKATNGQSACSSHTKTNAVKTTQQILCEITNEATQSCDCPAKCESVTFDVSPTYIPTEDGNKNTAHVVVDYDISKFMKYEQVTEYSVTELLNEVVIILLVWMGISVLSIIELIFALIHTCVKKCGGREKA